MNNTPRQAAPDDARLRARLLEQLFIALPGSLSLLVLATGVTLMAVQPYCNAGTLTLWAVALGVVLGARLVHWIAWRHVRERFSLAFWERGFALGSVLTVLCWATFIPLFMTRLPVAGQAFMAFLFSGITLGAAASLAAQLRLFLLYPLLLLLPMALTFLYEGGRWRIAMAAITLFYVAMAPQLAAAHQRLLRKTLEEAARLDARHREEARRARRDPLTGLPNRLALEEHLSQAIARARRRGRNLLVALFDLDGFKPVNDRFGHATGDVLLQMLASRLRASLRDGDVLCRLGGDEFVLVMEALGDAPCEAAASALRARLLPPLQSPVTLADGQEVKVTASLGTACFPAQGDTPEALLRQADAAMYRDKQRRR